MIFLGAGASKVFGVKTMQNLTDDLVKKLKDKGHGETIDDIINSLKAFRITPDFENIYMTLEALVNLIEGVKRSGGLTAYIATKRGLESIKGHPEFQDILADFRSLIYNECSIPRGVMKTKISLFDKLFEAIEKGSRSYGIYDGRFFISKTGVAGGGETFPIGNTIVTTNYDMAVELYHRWKNLPLVDGFRQTRGEYIKTLAFGEYAQQKSQRWLIKLHGSIWQFKQDSRIIQTIAAPDSLPLDISVGEQMMIYPVGEKPILREPYFSFYCLFKEQLWRVLIAIGYSFRDEPVNTAILERLNSQEPRLTLIVVNPHADDMVKNLGSLSPAVQERIIRINEPFRDHDDLFTKITTVIGSKGYGDYKSKI
jgi:hypothetical protein